MTEAPEAAPRPAAPDVAWKDLCRDADDPAVVAGFWAAITGRELVGTGDGGRRVLDPTSDARSEWVDHVPEPRTVKTRVHLDLRLPAADPGPLVAMGATVVREPDAEIRWWVLEDPEGNAFCAMPPAPPELGQPDVEVPTPFELVVDAADPAAIATWWAARTGGVAATREGAPYWWVEGAAGFPYSYWVFVAVPEPKAAKNRVHWDVTLLGTDVDGLVAAGATLLRAPDDEIRWWVLADPEGNEFCAFRARGE